MIKITDIEAGKPPEIAPTIDPPAESILRVTTASGTYLRTIEDVWLHIQKIEKVLGLGED